MLISFPGQICGYIIAQFFIISPKNSLNDPLQVSLYLILLVQNCRYVFPVSPRSPLALAPSRERGSRKRPRGTLPARAGQKCLRDRFGPWLLPMLMARLFSLSLAVLGASRPKLQLRFILGRAKTLSSRSDHIFPFVEKPSSLAFTITYFAHLISISTNLAI